MMINMFLVENILMHEGKIDECYYNKYNLKLKCLIDVKDIMLRIFKKVCRKYNK